MMHFSMLLENILGYVLTNQRIADHDLYSSGNKATNESMIHGMMDNIGGCLQKIDRDSMPKDDGLYSELFMRLLQINPEIDYCRTMFNTDRGLFVPFMPLVELADYYNIIDIGRFRQAVEMGMVELSEDHDYARANPYVNNGAYIGNGATCSAPYIVLVYNILASLFDDAKILEGGTGCAYHLANTAGINDKFRVFSADIDHALCEKGQDNIRKLGNGIEGRVTIGHANCLDPKSYFIKDNAPYNLIYFTFMFPGSGKYQLEPFFKILDEDGIIAVPVQGRGDPSKGNLIALQRRHNEVKLYPLLPVSFTPALEELR